MVEPHDAVVDFVSTTKIPEFFSKREAASTNGRNLRSGRVNFRGIGLNLKQHMKSFLISHVIETFDLGRLRQVIIGRSTQHDCEARW